MAEHLHQFLVEKIALSDGQDAVLVEHLGIELAKLVEEDVIFLEDIVGITGNHEEQQGVALDMTQETKAEALSSGSTFNDTGNIGHHKGFIVTIAHDTQGRFHSGEGIVGYLRTGIAERRHQGGFSGIGETYQSHIGQQFQLHDDCHLLHGLSGLRIAGSLIGSRTELVVTQSAASAF